MKPLYLCYDLRGIQSFIFKIPRLVYIVGGSALIDRFDRVTVPELAKQRGWDRVFSAGGKGAFRVPDTQTADAIQLELRSKAHELGVDIRFGRDVDYSEAAHCTHHVYPYLPSPSDLEGHPCPKSGLYPTRNDKAHPVVEKRTWSRGFPTHRWFEQRLDFAERALLPGAGPHGTVFMHDVSHTEPGFRSLGGRNRWAIICMDGNDMGRQFKCRPARQEPPERFLAWLQEMSAAMDDCTMHACKAGMDRVIQEWVRDPAVMDGIRTGCLTDEENSVVLPLRPLVVGGDDITVLCHAAHATAFVEAACETFSQRSRMHAAAAAARGIEELWPATGSHITISAGILFCGTTLPLASAIPYAHELLALAKGKGRELLKRMPASPAPACVDFEAVTESLLDTPLARRRRELMFLDEDLGGERIELTCRPYTVGQLRALEGRYRHLELPNTVLQSLLPGLQQGYYGRQVFYARLGKHQEELRAMLDESSIGDASCRWSRDHDARRTDVVDLATLAKESRRMSAEIVQ